LRRGRGSHCISVSSAPSLLVTGIAYAQKLPRLVLAGPSAAVSNPLIRMVDSGALADVAEVVEFVPWRDPDQLRVMALDGRADVLAMPTNVAANLYNRGAKLQLLNVSTWGVLWLVSRDPALKTLADLRGKELAMPFRGDMPDIVFQLLAGQQGIDVKKELRLRYVASPVDAMQLLVMRQVDHALLAEPAASMALRKTGSFPLNVVAPELHRSIDLQQEWGRVFARAARIPQAGIAVMGALRERPDVVARIEAEYARALAWCREQASSLRTGRGGAHRSAQRRGGGRFDRGQPDRGGAGRGRACRARIHVRPPACEKSRADRRQAAR